MLIGETINTSDICEGNEARRIVKRDKSIIMKADEPATVDAVLTSLTKEGNRYMKVRTRSLRIPMIGDKLSSRHNADGPRAIAKAKARGETVDSTPTSADVIGDMPLKMVISETESSCTCPESFL